MKKILAVVVLFVAALGMLSAHDSSVGLTLAPEWSWEFEYNGQKRSDNTGYTYFHLMATGDNYFGDDGGFGIEYGLGATFIMNGFSNGETIKAENAPVGFVFSVGPGYRYELNSLIGFSAGLGIRGYLYSDEIYSGNYSISSTVFYLDMYGKVAVDFTLLDFLRLDAGAMFGGPVYATSSATVNGSSASIDISRSGFFFSPFVSISYVF